jgi:hypothetical protein
MSGMLCIEDSTGRISPYLHKHARVNTQPPRSARVSDLMECPIVIPNSRPLRLPARLADGASRPDCLNAREPRGLFHSLRTNMI